MPAFNAFVSSNKSFVSIVQEKEYVLRYSAKHIFSPHTKVFVCSTINVFVIYLEGGLENPQKRMETTEKTFSKTSVNLRIGGAEKRTETSRDERTQENHWTSATYFCRCQVVFLCSMQQTSLIQTTVIQTLANPNELRLINIQVYSTLWCTTVRHMNLQYTNIRYE